MGFRASVDPRFEGKIPDFMDGIPDFMAGFPRSWKILEFETILESPGFLSSFEKSWKTDISRQKSWNFS